MEMEVEDEILETAASVPSLSSVPPFQILYRMWIFGAMFLINYGWYLFGLVVLYGAFRHKIYAAYKKWRSRRDEFEYAAKYHKDSELTRSRMEAVIAAREKLQREHERAAAEAERRRLEKEEKMRAELAAAVSDSAGPSTLSGKSLRADYLPLTGNTGSGGYRAPKKSCCKKGGGCG